MGLYVAVGGWLAGIWYAARWDGSPWLFLAGAAVALLALLLGRADPRLMLLSGCLLALCLGAARMDRALSGDLARWVGGGEAQVRGTITEQRGRGAYLVRVDEPASGTLLLRTRPSSKLLPGDELALQGRPLRADELEAYERGLARASGATLVLRDPGLDILATGQLGPVGGALARARGGLSILLERHVPERYAPVAEGLLLGGSLRVDREIKADFRASGISHILAASGYNVTLAAGMLLVALRPLVGRRRALPAAFVGIFLYAGLAGFSPSVVRAALMGMVGVFGLWLGRPRDSSRALAGAALLMTLWRPHALWDIGAQLSFVATAGLIWLNPVVARGLRRLGRDASEAVGVALTAQLATLPLGLYYFGGLSFWTPVANVIVAPLIPAGMLLGAVTMVGGWLWYPLGEALGRVVGWVVGAIVGVAELIAGLPGSGFSTDRVGLASVLLYYAALVLAVWLPGRRVSRLSAVVVQRPS